MHYTRCPFDHLIECSVIFHSRDDNAFEFPWPILFCEEFIKPGFLTADGTTDVVAEFQQDMTMFDPMYPVTPVTRIVEPLGITQLRSDMMSLEM